MDIISLSTKGQLTLPAQLRKKLGIRKGEVFTVEATKEGGILLKPAMIVALRSYTGDDIAAWDEDDTLSSAQEIKARKALDKLAGAGK